MAGFGKTPTTTTQGSLATNQFPASSVYPPNKGGSNPTDDFVVLESGPVTTDDDGNKSAPAGLYIKDGGDIAQGLTTDVAVVGDNPGTLSAKLRGLSKIWFDIWDSINHRVRVDGSGVIQPVSGFVSVSNLPGTQPVSGTFWQATQPVSNASLPLPTGAAQEAGHLATLDAHTPALGQVAMVSSSPVVIASNQSNLNVQRNFLEVAGNGAGVVNAVNTDLIPSTDVSNYGLISLAITGTYVGMLTFQISQDGTTWFSTWMALNGSSDNVNNIAISTSSTAGQIWIKPVVARYFRCRMTSYTSNASLVGLMELYTQGQSLSIATANAIQSGVWTQVPNAATSGGSTPYHLVSAASTNATTVKASAGQIYNYSILNTNAAIRYVHLYNKAANPTVGTDVPIKTFLIPATGQISGSFPVGSAFGTGIALSTTVSPGDAAADAVGAGDLIIDVDTK